ncbi:MAG: sodium/proline symporter [Lachnospiraceae bacterium]|nr:sodium/proline symporter [Lachnospiraceae bacterium]
MSTNFAILVVIVIYLLLVMFTGVMIGRRTKQSSEGFFLGGRGMGPLVTAMSAEASDMSSYLLMGIPGVAYLTGLADATWTAIGLGIGTYLNFLLVSKRLRKYSAKINAITIPGFFSKRFGDKSRTIETVAALIIIIFFIPYVASGLQAIGKLFNTLFSTDYMVGVVIGAVVILSYAVAGGFGSVAVMDLIQSIIMTFALIVIVLFAINKAGGWSNAMQYLSGLPGYMKLNATYDPSTNSAAPYGIITIISTMAWGLGYFGMPHILVRFMSIRHEDELKTSRRIATTWVFISMGVAIIIGIIGKAMSNEGVIAQLSGSDSERVIIHIANLLAENGVFFAIVAGIILAGILAATMSTADSQLLCAASSFSENIMKGTFKKKLDEKQSLVAARCTIIVIVLLAIIIASNPDSPIGKSIFQVVAFAWAGFGACFGPGMLLALFDKRMNKQGIGAGMIAGAVVIFVWKFMVRPLGGAWNIYELLPAFLVNLLVAIIVSKVTAPPEKEVQDTFDEVMTNI